MKWSSINYLKNDFFKNPALILFTAASIVCILLFLFGTYEREILALIPKSLILPSILLYYIQSCKKIERLVIVLFSVFFLADIVILIHSENSLVLIIILYIISYLIVLYSIIKKLKNDADVVITKNKIYNILILIFSYLFIYFQFIDFIFALNFEYKPLYLLASIILLVICMISTASCILRKTLKKWILIIAVSSMILCNFIFVCQIYYVEIESLYLWAIITQSVFYYFLMNYYLIDNKK